VSRVVGDNVAKSRGPYREQKRSRKWPFCRIDLLSEGGMGLLL
jgi:hypothetical protein